MRPEPKPSHRGGVGIPEGTSSAGLPAGSVTLPLTYAALPQYFDRIFREVAEAERLELLRRLDAWEPGVDPGPLIRWAAASIRGSLR